MIVMNLQMPSEDRFCKRLSCFKKWKDMNLNKLLQWWSTCNCLTNKISSQIGFFVGLLSKNIDRKLVTVVLDHVIVVQLLCHVWLFVIPWTAVGQTSLSLTISWSLLKLTSITSVMPSNHLVLCRPLLLLPTIPPSIRVFSNESVLRVRWPKYWSFSFSISPSNEYSGLISFRIDCFDLLVVQRTLKSLLQHRSSKASVHWCSTVFMVQLSHPYMTAGKTIALTRWTFGSKVMSLLFNMLSTLAKRRVKKVGLKLNIPKTKIMASGPITSWEIDGETVETVSDFVFGEAAKSLQMVTATMTLKDAYSLEGKLWPT